MNEVKEIWRKITNPDGTTALQVCDEHGLIELRMMKESIVDEILEFREASELLTELLNHREMNPKKPVEFTYMRGALGEPLYARLRQWGERRKGR